MKTLSLIAAFVVACLVWQTPAGALEPRETLVLVAQPSLTDPLFGESILVAHELPGGEYVGFILNRPTALKLTEAFPNQQASREVTDPLYLGGPSVRNTVFALVHSPTTPEEGTVALTGDLYLAISEAAVDDAMAAATEERARFFVGAVLWKSGELDAEINNGNWFVLKATPELVLPKKTVGLWADLVRKVRMAKYSI